MIWVKLNTLKFTKIKTTTLNTSNSYKTKYKSKLYDNNNRTKVIIITKTIKTNKVSFDKVENPNNKESTIREK